MDRYMNITPDGTKDYMFNQAKKIRETEEKIREVFEKSGYGEVITPAVEFYDVFATNGSHFPQESLYKTVDSKGRMLVMRPDSTIPIARMISSKLNLPEIPLKLYYSQAVYRQEDTLKGRKNEIRQMGIENIGMRDTNTDVDVLQLAARAIESAGVKNYRLEIGNIGLFNGLLDKIGASEKEKEEIYMLVLSKNYAALKDILENFSDKKGAEIIMELPKMFGGIEVITEIKKMLSGYDRSLIETVLYLEEIVNAMNRNGYGDHIFIDLGLVNQVDYYTGLIFRGYADKIGEAVVSGGRYDDLYKGMGTDVCAVGFAINVEQLMAASKLVKEEGKKGKSPLRIAITKGRMEEQVGKLLTKAGYEISALEDKGRKLIIPIAGGSMEIVLAKAPDVITYVEHGVCDIGIVGKDTILEYGGTYYEVLDLKLGKCRFALATQKGEDFYEGYKTKRIATKYPNVTKKYFNDKGMDIEIIKIEGSVELAPLLSLSDGIVDIVETGTTLKENGLEVQEIIREISARAIVNIAGMKFKKEEIEEFMQRLGENIDEDI